MIKGNYNVNNANKVTFRYNQLTSSTYREPVDVIVARDDPSAGTQFLTFPNSNYTMGENIKSGVGEWNSVFGTFTNDLIIGDTFNDESRAPVQLFPFVVIGDGAGSAYTRSGRSRSRRTTCSPTSNFSCRTASPSSRRTTP